MIQLIGGSGGWSVNRRDRGVLKGGLNQVDDLTLPAVSPQPPDPQVENKLLDLAGTSKKRIHVLMFYAQRLISCGAASWCLFTFRVKNVKTTLWDNSKFGLQTVILSRKY